MAILEETLTQTDTLIADAESLSDLTRQHIAKLTELEQKLNEVTVETKLNREQVGGLSVDDYLQGKAIYESELQTSLTNLQTQVAEMYNGLASHPVDPKAEE